MKQADQILREVAAALEDRQTRGVMLAALRRCEELERDGPRKMAELNAGRLSEADLVAHAQLEALERREKKEPGREEEIPWSSEIWEKKA
jgi:hypothetical protein